MMQSETTTTIDATTTDALDLAGVDRTALAHLDLATISVGDLADWLYDHGAAHLSAIERIELAERLTRRRFIVRVGGLIGAAALGACGAGEQATTSTATRTLETMYGPVDLPANPQRVLPGLAYVMDYALVLNLPLVAGIGFLGAGDNPFAAYQQAAYPDVLADLPSVTTVPPNYEQIAALQPDCIIDPIAAEDIERYQLLGEIAPTYAISPNEAVEEFQYGRNDWRSMLHTIAQAFERGNEAEQFITAYDTRATDLRARLVDKWADATFAALFVGADSLFVYGREREHIAQILFDDLGLQPAAFLTPDSQRNMSFEALPNIDADVLLVPLGPQPGSLERDRSPLIAIEANPLWQRLPAIAQNQVYEFVGELALPSPLTATAFLDYVERTLLS